MHAFRFCAAAALVALSIAATPAIASNDLPPGDVGSPLPSPFPADFSTATLLASSLAPVTGINMTGTFRSAVYRNVATAADAMTPGFTLGQTVLDFVYQFSNAIDSRSIDRLRFQSWSDSFAVIAWQQQGDVDGAGSLFVRGTQQAIDADRSADGSTLDADFGMGSTNIADLLNPGESTWALLFRVNASGYKNGSFQVRDVQGTTLSLVNSFAPAAPIPEPETCALMAAGLAALGFVARRRGRRPASSPR